MFVYIRSAAFIIVVTQKLVFQQSKNVIAKCTETLLPPPCIQFSLIHTKVGYSRCALMYEKCRLLRQIDWSASRRNQPYYTTLIKSILYQLHLWWFYFLFLTKYIIHNISNNILVNIQIHQNYLKHFKLY